MGAQTANPMAEYLLKLQLIVSNTEFKNDEEARKYETLETRLKGDQYVSAVNKTDTFESHQYSDVEVYDVLAKRGYDEDRIFALIKNPAMIPYDVKEELLDNARAIIISTYVEENKYYSSLAGIPFPGTKTEPADPIIMIPDEFYEQYISDAVLMRSQPIHEMPDKYQELFINSKYYKQILNQYPDVMYLKYIGSNKIPIAISRPARDGDIMKINDRKLSTHHPIYGNVSVGSDIVHAFSNVYRSTRDYVYQTLRGDFSSIYANYNDVIRYLTIYMSIGACLNEFQKTSNKLIYMNNVTANNLFTLYGLPSVIMEGSPMVEFLKKFRMMLMDKGTNYVYRVKDLIGYNDTDIYTLVMVKQQIFDNGRPVYDYSQTPPVPKYKIVFRRLGTADDNTSYFKFRDSVEEYSLEEIMSDDPRWWNTPEVESMLNDMNYTLSNSKYIQLSTHMSMTDVWWQSVIFLRGMMDRRSETMNMMLTLNRDIDDASTMTLYDAILSLIVMMHWQLNIKGSMYYPQPGYNYCFDLLFDGYDENGKYKTRIGDKFKLASFNYDVRVTDPTRWAALQTYEYLNPDYFIPMVTDLLDRVDNNVGESIMKDVRSVYDYLAEKVRTAVTIHDYRQATEAYNTLFLVDPIRDWMDPTNKRSTKDVICERFNIGSNEYSTLQTYFNIPGTKYKNEYEEWVYYDPDILIDYDGDVYGVFFHDVMNNNILDVLVRKCVFDEYDETYKYDPEADGAYLFNNPDFVALYNEATLNYPGNIAIQISTLSQTIKDNYKQILIDKVNIDIGNSDYGPTTFEYLLMMENTSLYDYITKERKENPQEIITMMRTIIAALEIYTNSSLSALTCSVIGSENYVNILKEVISYFKSYMVEFTRDEFTYIFGGILDNGGNSDMLSLIDEMHHGSIEISPVDSMSLFDVSHADVYFGMADDNVDLMYDEVLFRLEGEYRHIVQSGFELWYDDGKRITKTPSFEIADDENVVGNFVSAGGNNYKVIINIQNIESKYPPGYYGNVL